MKLDELRVFIGYDGREPDAARVCEASLLKRSSIELEIEKLHQGHLRQRGIYSRPQDEPFSTEFAMTRFLVPYLCKYEGFALFVDCDFLFTADIAELVREIDETKAVSVVQHDYTPSAKFKMDGQPQVSYPRKNWSSLMFFRNDSTECIGLTRYWVNTLPASFLHQFKWVKDEKIGKLPIRWNWLEGEYEWGQTSDLCYSPPPAGIHFTNGTPELCEKKSIQFGDLWTDELRELNSEDDN